MMPVSPRIREKYFPPPPPSNRSRWFLTLILVLALIAIAIAALTPIKEDPFTEFFILDEGGRAVDYPIEIEPGSASTIRVGIGNHEGVDLTYFVEIYIAERTAGGGDIEGEIKRINRLDQWNLMIGEGNTEYVRQTYSVRDPTYNTLILLLFVNEVPPDLVLGTQRVNAAYRTLSLNLIPQTEPGPETN